MFSWAHKPPSSYIHLEKQSLHAMNLTLYKARNKQIGYKNEDFDTISEGNQPNKIT